MLAWTHRRRVMDSRHGSRWVGGRAASAVAPRASPLLLAGRPRSPAPVPAGPAAARSRPRAHPDSTLQPADREGVHRWIRRYVLFHGRRHPREMGAEELSRFLSSLAVDAKVSASTENQALAAPLFLYREVLGQDVPWLQGVVWRDGSRAEGRGTCRGSRASRNRIGSSLRASTATSLHTVCRAREEDLQVLAGTCLPRAEPWVHCSGAERDPSHHRGAPHHHSGGLA